MNIPSNPSRSRHAAAAVAASLLALLALACGPSPADDQAAAQGRPEAKKEPAPKKPLKKPENGAATAWPSEAEAAGLNSKLKVIVSVPEEPSLLGEVVTVGIQVANESNEPVRCAQVIHDVLSAWLEISTGESVFRYIKIQPDYFDSVFRRGSARPYLPHVTLGPGQSAAATIRFVPPAAGAYRVRANYTGFGPRCPEPCRSEWASFEVAPDGELERLGVLLSTDLGDIEIDMYLTDSLSTAINFVTLVNASFYDGLQFHRVAPGGYIQTGDPTGTGKGHPDFYIPQEFSRRPHIEGTVSMARTTEHVDTAGSQFFLCVSTEPDLQRYLDGQYTVFGFVSKGIETVRKINSVSVDSGLRPAEPVRILKATLVKR